MSPCLIICDVSCATDHVIRFTRPSCPIFAYYKQSKIGGEEDLGMRLGKRPVWLGVVMLLHLR